MNENNKIKKAVNRIVLSDAAKERILNECEPDEIAVSTSSPRIMWTLVTAVVLLFALTFGTLAAVGVFKTAPGENKTHVGTDPELNDVQEAGCVIVSDDGEFLLRCNTVTGGQDKVYIDCTLTRKDGGVIIGVSGSGGELPILRSSGGSLRLSNEEYVDVFFFTLSDSTETEYHLEGMALMVKTQEDGMDFLK